jgi:hypothetical protein
MSMSFEEMLSGAIVIDADEFLAKIFPVASAELTACWYALALDGQVQCETQRNDLATTFRLSRSRACLCEALVRRSTTRF